jgi:hypothetical protein
MPKAQDVFEKILLTLIVALFTGAVSYIRDVADSMNKLNEKIAIIIGRIEYHELALKSYGQRIDALEIRKGK